MGKLKKVYAQVNVIITYFEVFFQVLLLLYNTLL